MGETVRWAQNCLRIFKLSKSVNGKESIPAQFPKAIFIPKEEDGLENPPQETDYPYRIFELSVDMPDFCPPSPPPPAGKKLNLPTAA